ncbi:hypothetical protein [Allopusillimonas ginsengisoli]|uniref:hypothetical protein n=1 Tax=Allopusillimonas ginsengisoli TaxID=453575 RepID=UPI0010214065|nr:hypothetical protein [Allopusillimonas ginsengisoli]TEA76915.1 hypothetical protein ERE07_17905 [Allopusillimonas ginsengisoli]
MTHFMRRATFLTVIALASACNVAAKDNPPPRDDCSAPANQQIAEGCNTLTKFIDAFNAKDPEAFAASNHYPHIRITGPNVQTWQTAEDYMRDNTKEQMESRENNPKFKGWKASRWDWRRLDGMSENTMHFTTMFSRLNGEGEVLGAFESLYILTKKDGKWGVQARSSFAGVAGKNTAY